MPRGRDGCRRPASTASPPHDRPSRVRRRARPSGPRAHVPLRDQRRSCDQTRVQGPNDSGNQGHWHQVWATWGIASTTVRRSSACFRPRFPGALNTGSSNSHCSSVRSLGYDMPRTVTTRRPKAIGIPSCVNGMRGLEQVDVYVTFRCISAGQRACDCRWRVVGLGHGAPLVRPVHPGRGGRRRGRAARHPGRRALGGEDPGRAGRHRRAARDPALPGGRAGGLGAGRDRRPEDREDPPGVGLHRGLVHPPGRHPPHRRVPHRAPIRPPG